MSRSIIDQLQNIKDDLTGCFIVFTAYWWRRIARHNGLLMIKKRISERRTELDKLYDHVDKYLNDKNKENAVFIVRMQIEIVELLKRIERLDARLEDLQRASIRGRVAVL